MTLQRTIDGPADATVPVLGPSLGTGTAMFDAQVTALLAELRPRHRCAGPDRHQSSPAVEHASGVQSVRR